MLIILQLKNGFKKKNIKELCVKADLGLKTSTPEPGIKTLRRDYNHFSPSTK